MRYRGFDLNQVVTLRSLLDTRSVSETARELNVTQPAVSSALKRLREQFGDELLVQRGQRMITTEFAEKLMAAVTRLLADADALLQAGQPFDPSTSERRFVIETSDHVLNVVLAPALRRISKLAPNLQFSIVPLERESWLSLEQGYSDILILPTEFQAPGHPSRMLFRDRYAVLADAGNPILGERLDEERLRSLPVLAVSFGRLRRARGGYAGHVYARMEDHAQFIVTEFNQIPQLLEGTDRIAIVPERMAAQMAQRFSLGICTPDTDNPVLDIVAQINKTRKNDIGLNWVLDQFGISAPN